MARHAACQVRCARLCAARARARRGMLLRMQAGASLPAQRQPSPLPLSRWAFQPLYRCNLGKRKILSRILFTFFFGRNALHLRLKSTHFY